LNAEVVPKRLQLLHQLLPTATIVALLVNPTDPNAEALTKDAEVAARTLGLQLHVTYASTEEDFDTAFATLVRVGASGLVISPDPFFGAHGEKLAALSVRHLVPAISQRRQFVMSYGGNLTNTYRDIGVYAGRILKGERPADLPVQQATKVELVINLKTAKALGLTVPETLLATADEVIQ
jgi:putative tryptophan/tyrosine transport system substrate-binding protein